MHEVLVNRLGGLSLPRKSVVRLTDRPDMTLDVYRGRKTTNQQNQQKNGSIVHQTWNDCNIYSFKQYSVHLLRISCSSVRYYPDLSWIVVDLPRFSEIRSGSAHKSWKYGQNMGRLVETS